MKETNVSLRPAMHAEGMSNTRDGARRNTQSHRGEKHARVLARWIKEG
jgi:hypothetical protein